MSRHTAGRFSVYYRYGWSEGESFWYETFSTSNPLKAIHALIATWWHQGRFSAIRFEIGPAKELGDK